MPDRNIVLTGIPRSGTTLAVALLNQRPDTLALSEPMDIDALGRCPSQKARIAQIQEFFADIRALVAARGRIPQRTVAGEETNYFGGSQAGGRKSTITGSTLVELDRPLSARHVCVIKHPNAFTALLGELVEAFECLAIVRNPVSVLASWHSLDAPLASGHAPMAEHFDQRLRIELGDSVDTLDRQLRLLAWYFDQYRRHLPRARIVRYEDIVSSGGHALLSALDGRAAADAAGTPAATTLHSRNASELYDRRFMRRLGDALASRPRHPLWHFYTPAEIRRISHAATLAPN